MKVLSLTEPYATLIKNNIKTIETRSWKTNYRGELYIHASSTRIKKETKSNRELMQLVNLEELNFGKIILKCNLTDCIYMTNEYIKNIKKTDYQNYLCGIYEEGRYAWILDNIEVLATPIYAKGKLGIWEYQTESSIKNERNKKR